MFAKVRTLLSRPVLTMTGQYWFHKASYSIADQIVISGANFALNILLAKWTSAAEYGAFSVAYSFFLVMAGIHSAVILEPMGVIAPSTYSNRLTDYRFITLLMHFALSIGLSIGIVVSMILFLGHESPLLPHFFALCISISWILLFYLIRRSCYLEAKTDIAFKGSVTYATVLLSLLFLLKVLGKLRSQDSFYIFAIANLCAAVTIHNYMSINFWKHIRLIAHLKVMLVIKAHWEYGRWILAASIFHSAGNAVYLPTVGWVLGYAEAGILRSIQIFLQPLQQILFALSSLLVPWLSSHRHVKGSDFPLEMMNKVAFGFLAFGISYFIMFILSGQYIINFAYPNYPYAGIRILLYFVGITGVGTALSQALGTNLRAMGDSNAILLSKLASLIATLIFGIALIFIFHLHGAGFGMVLSIFAEVVAMLLYIRIKYKKEPSNYEQYAS